MGGWFDGEKSGAGFVADGKPSDEVWGRSVSVFGNFRPYERTKGKPVKRSIRHDDEARGLGQMRFQRLKYALVKDMQRVEREPPAGQPILGGGEVSENTSLMERIACSISVREARPRGTASNVSGVTTKAYERAVCSGSGLSIK
jgi:hypothetical protein